MLLSRRRNGERINGLNWNVSLNNNKNNLNGMTLLQIDDNNNDCCKKDAENKRGRVVGEGFLSVVYSRKDGPEKRYKFCT